MPEVRMILQLLGSDIEELPGLSDCPDPMDPDDFTTVAANLASSNPDKFHYTDQYFNELNLKAHQQTGYEIVADLSQVDYFFGFLGTCGTTMGAGKVLKGKCNTKVIGVVAEAGHHIPGGRNINELWEVGFFKYSFYDELIQGTTNNAIEGMQMLNQKSGVLGGPTSGLIYYTALQRLQEIDKTLDGQPPQTAVFIVCDRVEQYLSYAQKYSPEIFMQETSSKPKVNNLPKAKIEDSQTLTPENLNHLVNSDNPPLIIDIRGNFAFSLGHIQGSINILGELLTQIVEQGSAFPKSKKIVVICTVGKVSRRYAAFLEVQGYDAYSLDGGISSWKKAGLSLAKMSF